MIRTLVRRHLEGRRTGGDDATILLPLLVILLVGCGGAAGSPPADGQTAPSSAPSKAGGSGASSIPTAAAATAAPSDSPGGSSATTLPADCAEGFAKYLVAIEPLVSGFDATKATLGDLSDVEEAVHSKSIELLKANNSTAPYSCPDAGLDWAYFDASTAWDAALSVAASSAPGTVAYLTALRAMSGMDVSTVKDYGVEGCDAAVASIKKRVAAQSSGGKAGVEKMGIEDGLALLGLYKAYLRDVQNEVCPRDALGNDEFDFFGAMG